VLPRLYVANLVRQVFYPACCRATWFAWVNEPAISFTMDLYDPLFITRPVVEPELFASLRPQTYEGEVDRLGREAQRDGAMVRGLRLKAAAPAQAGFGGAGGFAGSGAPASAPEAAISLDFRRGVASAAVATALGEYFQYQIEQPVSLARQKSALLPIVNQAVEASKVSIYNETVQPKYPLHGLRFKNTTGLHLMQGPITIFEGNSYAGDARIGDLQPKETRLVSYAVDLGTEVAPEVKGACAAGAFSPISRQAGRLKE
jgi:hypothetical protein